MLLQRLAADGAPDDSGDVDPPTSALERSTIVNVLVSVLKEKRPDDNSRDPLCKLIADRLVVSLGAIIQDGKSPTTVESVLKSWDFQQANLNHCWWKGVDAREVDFFAAHIQNAGLAKASLRGAVFFGACLAKTVLRDADLRNADLRSADLRGTVLTGARLENARLDGAIYDSSTQWPDGFDFRNANLRPAAVNWLSRLRND